MKWNRASTRIAAAIVLCLGLAEIKGQALDTLKYSQLYREGEFQVCSRDLESALSRPARLTQEERAFAAKYLGVIYASNPATEEKGRYFFNQFLSYRPNGNILDLYVSKKIKEIFAEVVEERRATGTLGAEPTIPSAEMTRPKNEPEPKATPTSRKPVATTPAHVEPKGGSKVWVWVVGTTAIAGAAAAGYYFVAQPPKKTVVMDYVVEE